MTLYTIPDLVWEIEGRWCTANASGTQLIIQIHAAHVVLWLPDDVRNKPYNTIELAQAAANDWYKAKMAEGLKVATVEELKQAIEEVGR